MVLELAIAGQALDLSDDVRIRLVRTNPFFQDEITGEYTFPFNLPVTPTNAQILQYTHIPASGGDRRRDYPAMLQAGPFSLVGTLQVREMSRKVYQANLIVPPGNIPAKTWNKKLQEFNLGSVTFPSKMKSTQHWVADIKGLVVGSVAQIELYDKNNAKLFSATYFPVVDPGGWDQVDLLEGYMKTASESSALKDREFVGFLQGDQMIFNLPPSETLGKIRFVYASPINREAFEIPFTEIKYRTWADYQASDGVSNLMLADDRFKFPVIYNEDWYDSEQAKGWIKYVNYFQGALYRFNDPAVPTQYSLSPCLNLKWVLTQLFLQQGYRLESSFFDTYASLHLFNNKSLDEQVPGLAMPFNQFKDTIVFAEHLPDLSLKEFIEQLGVLFFHRWELDPILKVARFVPLSTIAESGPVLDFTEQMVREYTIQANELTQHVFKFSVDSSDALAKDSIDETADAQTKASYQVFKSFPEKEDPSAERTQRHETSFSPLFQTITEEPATAAAPARTVYSSLQAKQRCISPLFKQEKTGMASPRLFFYAGIQEVTDLVNSEKNGSTATLKVPSGRIQTDNLKLVWSDLIERYGKTWLELLNNSFDLKIGMDFSAVDLARLTFAAKQHLSGLNYLPAEIDVELGKYGLKSTAVVTWKKS